MLNILYLFENKSIQWHTNKMQWNCGYFLFFISLIKLIKNFKNSETYKDANLLHVGYRGWLPPTHPSVPSLIPLPHFWQTDRDRSGPHLDCPSSKSNLLYSQSMEKRNWNRSKRNWEIPISDQNRSAFSHLLK